VEALVIGGNVVVVILSREKVAIVGVALLGVLEREVLELRVDGGGEDAGGELRREERRNKRTPTPTCVLDKEPSASEEEALEPLRDRE
jgi:hypothetical protein